jgi:hypothetical protein
MATATLKTVERNIRVIPEVYGGFSETLAGYVDSTNTSWPYMRYSSYDAVAQHLIELTATAFCSFMVRVHDPVKWAEYSVTATTIPISPFVFRYDDYGNVTKVSDPGDYAVIWQTAAAPEFYSGLEEKFYNYDNWREPFATIRKAMDTDQYGMLAATRVMTPSNETGNSVKIRKNYFSKDDPRTDFYYPVVRNSTEKNSPTVAYLYGIISWSKYFSNVLLKKDEGVYCVLQNTCNQTFSWLVSATGVKFLGEVSVVCF